MVHFGPDVKSVGRVKYSNLFACVFSCVGLANINFMLKSVEGLLVVGNEAELSKRWQMCAQECSK